MIIFERDTKLIVNANSFVADKSDRFTNGPFVIYPNPTENRTINISFVNKPSGVYSLQLVNNAGQLVYNGVIKLNGANKTSIKLRDNIATGSYRLTIIDADGIQSVQQVFIK